MQPAGERPIDDLTARARIRDAALEQFAEHGVKGATIRGIAEAAGVSPGLVQHHFSSKNELRRACDAYAMEVFRRTKGEALEGGGLRNPSFLGIAARTSMRMQRYVARAMVDGSAAAAEFFDELVEFTEDYLKRDVPGLIPPRTNDLHAYAAVMTGMSVGLMVLHDHMSRALGADTLTLAGYPRLATAVLDIFSDNIISPELEAQVRAALAQVHTTTTTPQNLPEGGQG